jgi:hypothetical protein
MSRSSVPGVAPHVRPIGPPVKLGGNTWGQSSSGMYLTRVARSPTANPTSPPITSGTGKKPPMIETASPSNSPLTVQIKMAGQRGSRSFGSFLTGQP